MREIDTEAPVIWPAWCYSGETGTEDSSPQTASSPLQSNTAPGVTTISLSSGGNATTGITPITSRGRTKRKTQSHAIALDKMLNNMMMNTVIGVDNAHKRLLADNNSFYKKIKCENEINLRNNNNNSINNNNNNNISNSRNGDISNSNNNNIKSERFSPTNGEVQSSMSRSRSVTPASYPGTSPHPVDLIHNQNSSTPLQPFRPEFQTRNYSDIMRNLAAKYNNNNSTNINNNNSSNNSNNNSISNNISDVQNKRNTLYATKFVNSPTKSTKESSSENKKTNLTSQIPNSSNNDNNNNNNLMSSLMSGLPCTSTMMPPVLDMSSTQALVTLARAAKDAEIQQLLRKVTTPQTTPNTENNNNLRNQNVSNLSNLFPPILPSPHFSLINFHQYMNTLTPQSNVSGAVNANNPVGNTTNENISLPLDLSSSPVNKKMKIETSSSSSWSGDSFLNNSSAQLQQQQQQSVLQSQQQHEPLQHHRTPTPTAVHTKRCQAQSEEINAWTIDQVCDFVSAIDICAEYVQKFREQSIDGTGLPLLTEEHLTHSLGMKLGPALKLRSLLVKKIGGPCPCASCTRTTSNTPRPMSSEPSPGC